MKKIIFFLTLLSCGVLIKALASDYQITIRSDRNKIFTFYIIKQNGEEVANFCAVNSDNNFKFFSFNDDPEFFNPGVINHTENRIDSLATVKNLGPVNCVILGDLKKTGLSINFNYFWESIGIMFFADPYLKRAGVISSKKNNNRYFLETNINNKDVYCLLVLKENGDEKRARKLIKLIKEFKTLDFKLIPIVDFPLKLISYDNKKTIIYESKEGHPKYSCLFISTQELP